MESIINKRLKHLKETFGVDSVIDTYDVGRFTEFVTRTGGDVQTFRVYGDNPNNFMVTEK